MTTEQETVETKPNLTPSEAFEDLIELLPNDQRVELTPSLALIKRKNNDSLVVEATLQSTRDGRVDEQAKFIFDSGGLLSYCFERPSTFNEVLGIPPVTVTEERRRNDLPNTDEQKNFARRIVPFAVWLQKIIEDRDREFS